MADLDIECLGVCGGGTLTINEKVEAPSQSFFRSTRTLGFKTGGLADGMTVDSDTTALKAEFRCYDYTLSQHDLDPILSSSGPMVIVSLGTPRHVRGIKLKSGTTSGHDYDLEFYRLDINTPAESPTVSAHVRNDTAMLDEGAGFSDARFAIQLSGGPHTLSRNDIAEVHLRSSPTGPRFGFADPVDLEADPYNPLLVTWFWQMPGVVDDANAGLSVVDEGKSMAEALELFLNDLLETGSGAQPGQISAALVIESDTPCQVEVNAFAITYHPELASLPPRDGVIVEKQVLRFPGDRVESQNVLIRVPRSIVSGSIRAVESLAEGRMAAVGGDGCSPGLLESISQGAYVGVDKWVAQDHAHGSGEAVSVSSVALGLMPVSETTELQVEVQEDWRGCPSGRKLAEGRITVEQTGGRCWSMLRFPSPIVITSARHWILAKATSGSAIWLVESKDSSVRLLERADRQNGWSETSVLSGVQALYRLLTPDIAEAAKPVTATIGDREIMGTCGEDDVWTYDLTAALKTYLEGQPPEGDVASVPLTFTTALSGFITVYPPSIEFDV